MQLISKERVNISLEWKEPDRVPIQLYTTPEIHNKLTKYFAEKDILEVFGVDFRSVSGIWKGKTKKTQGDIFYDIWGAGYQNQKSQGAAALFRAGDRDRIPIPPTPDAGAAEQAANSAKRAGSKAG